MIKVLVVLRVGRIYVKIGNNWIGVAYKHITKDNMDDTEKQLKLLNIRNMDML